MGEHQTAYKQHANCPAKFLAHPDCFTCLYPDCMEIYCWKCEKAKGEMKWAKCSNSGCKVGFFMCSGTDHKDMTFTCGECGGPRNDYLVSLHQGPMSNRMKRESDKLISQSKR